MIKNFVYWWIRHGGIFAGSKIKDANILAPSSKDLDSKDFKKLKKYLKRKNQI